MATVIDLFGGRRGADAARLLTGFGIVAAVPTAASGLSDWSETYGSQMRIGLVHAAGNVVGLGLRWPPRLHAGGAAASAAPA